MSKGKKISLLILLLFIIYTIGIIGYIYIEGYSFGNAAYMTAITLSTVGFGEVKALSPIGKFFTTCLIFSGVTLVVYSFGYITSFFVEGDLNEILRGAKIKKMLLKMNKHTIICGGGTTAHKIIENFIKNNEKFVVIEKSLVNIEILKKEYGEDLLVLQGDATRDEVLEEAGINKAKVVVTILPTDAQNVFIALSAKSINKDIVVISRAIEYNSEAKLTKAGADYVISPSKIVAQRISNIASKHNVMDFLKFMSQNELHDYSVELVEIPERSYLVNKSLREAELPKLTGLNVIGIEDDGELKLNPLSTTKIIGRSKLLVLGNSEQIQKLTELVKEEY